MPKFNVRVNGRFGEGWERGDVVEMDEMAARVPLEEGAIERVGAKQKGKKSVQEEEREKQVEEKRNPRPQIEPEIEEIENGRFECTICDRTHYITSKIGQKHLREANNLTKEQLARILEDE